MKKEYLKYIFLAIYYFICITFIYIAFRLDTYPNYGFSYGIVTGNIPYKDFNQIVPLFSSFLYSILLIFNHSIIVYYFEQTILLLLMSYLLFKILDEKAWIPIVLLFLPIIIPFAYVLFPGYNFILLLELILLIYLNHFNKSDKLIGLVSGITIITKHNIGIFILIVSILYVIKYKKKVLNRLLYGLLPILVFFIILLLYGNYYEFIDLCILGTSDFMKNLLIDKWKLSLVLISIVIMIIKYIKDKNKNISYYYLLVYLLIIFPIIDEYHLALYLMFYIVVYLYNSKLKIKNKRIPIISFIIINIFICSWILLSNTHFNRIKIYSYNNYEITFMEKKEKKNIDELNKYIKNKKYILFSDPNMVIFLRVINNDKLNKYIILFNGNLGSKGIKGVLKEIEKNNNTYYIVDTRINCKGKKGCQYIEEVPKYVMKNYELVKEIDYYKIYYNKRKGEI